MPMLAHSGPGKVIALWGSAVIRGADGKMRALKVGDVVQTGDVILTTQNGIVQIAPEGQTATAQAKPPAAQTDIDRVIAGLDQGETDVAPAAGLAGGGGGSLEEGLRVERIGEAIGAADGLGSAEPLPTRVFETTTSAVTLATPTTTVPGLQVGSSAISATEEGAATNLGLGTPTGIGTTATVTVTHVPAIGEVHKADGSLVTAGTALTPADLPGLVYVPPQDYDGKAPVGNFDYTVTSGSQTAAGTTVIALGTVNDAPIAQDATLTGAEDALLPTPLGGSDVDGTITGVTIVTVPPGSALLLADGVTHVVAGQTLTPAQAAGLLFQPAPDFNGNTGITFTVTDDGGLVSSPATLNLVVTPVNDAPVATPDLISTAINTPVTGIVVLANDTDVEGDTLSLSAASLADPTQGTLVVNADGTLSFTPALNVTGTVLVHYTVADPSGATSSSTLTINVGNNTPPTGADATLTLAEDGSRSFSATDFGFAGADAGQSLAAVRIDTLPGAGSLSFNNQPVVAGQLIPAAALGNLVFTPAADANGAGYASFTFSVQDNAGGFDTSPNTITLDVTPMPDAAVIGGQVTGATIEDTQTTASGTLTIVDPDAGQQAFVAQTNVAGAHGTFSVDAAGQWTYLLNNADPAVQALGQGQTLPAESFTVASIDGTTQTITVSITGVNDAAAITGTAVGSVTEDGTVLSQGQLNVTDVDSPATFNAASAAGTYGNFSIDASGAWTYTLRNGDANVQALTSAQHPTETFTVTTADGTSSVVTVTVNGANEAPTAAVTPASGAEDAVGIPVTLAGSDVDGSVASFTVSALPSNGTLFFGGVAVVAGAVIPATAGSAALTFVPNADWNGSTSISFSAIDNEGAASATVSQSITVTAVNDAPVASPAAFDVLEDAAIVSGSVSATDIDSVGPLTYALTGAAPAGLTFNADGSYSFDPSNAAYQALAAGQTLVITVPYRATDDLGAPSNIANLTITVTGTNDDAVVTGVSLGSVTEDGTVLSQGQLNVTDVDSPATFTAASVAGTYGNFSIDASGKWDYTLRNGDANVQALTSAQHPTETFTVTTADGTTQNVVVTVNGANEAPTASVTPASGAEDAVGIPVTLAGADVDGSVASFTVSALPNNGTLFFGGVAVTAGAVIPATAGSAALTFVPNANWNGSTSISFAATDNEGASSTTVSQAITVTAVNDAPVASPAAFDVVEDATIVTGSVTATDVDAVGPLTYALTGAAPAGLTFNSNGTYSFDPSNSAYQSLAAGQSLVITVPYRATDDQGAPSNVANLTITVTGVNDAAVVTGVATGSVTEDGTVVSQGQLNVTDVDSPATFTAASVAGTYGDFSIDASGAWTYTLRNGDANVQALTSAQHPTDTFSVTTADGTTQNVVVTINGANEAPTAAVTPASGAEDAVGIPVALAGADVDGSIASFTVDTLPSNGTLFFGGVAVAAGAVIPATAGGAALTFVPNANWNGSTSISFTATDNEGASSTTVSQSITVTAVNDAPVASAGAFSVFEDAPVVNGSVSATDVDAVGPLTYALTGAAPAGLTFNSDGSYSFDPSNAAYQSLAAGQSLIITVPYRATDDQGAPSNVANLTITVTGTNDAPVANADAGSLRENATLFAPAIAGVLLNDTDVDSGDSKTVTAVAFGSTAGSLGSPLAGTYGTLTLGADGSVLYAANRPAAEALVAGQVVTEQFTYTMRDAAGATSTATITFTITGTNDTPTITGSLAGAVKEDTTLSATGTLTVTDPDAGQSNFVVQSGVVGTYGSFGIDAAGHWTYTLNNGASNVQGLSATSSVTDSFVVTTADGTTRTVVVTVTGTNDAPVAANAAFTVAEDAALVSGAVTATDVDAGATRSFALTGAAPAGLTFHADGSYTFDASNAAYQSLRAGQSTVITVPFRATDDQGATSSVANLVITVTGTNDAPVAQADVGALNENATLTVNAATGVLANDTDIDAGDTRTVSAVSFGASGGSIGSALNGTYGTLTLNADGSYSYVANRPAADALVAGQVVTEQFSYTARDAAGATSTSTLTFTITGQNDVPTITGPLTGTVKEDTTLTSTGTLVVSDPDAGQSAFVAQSGVAGTYGSFSIDTSGHWTYTLNNGAANVQALGAASSFNETFAIATADGTTRNVVVTVTGTNDAPTVVADSRTTLEDTAASGNVLSNDSDIDGGTLSLTQFSFGGNTYAAGATATIAGVGTLTMGSTGAYTFTPAANYGGAVPAASYVVSDGSATSSSALALTITPVADAPTVVVNGSSTTDGTTTPPTLPPSVGLQVQFYDNIAAVGSSNAVNISTVEAGVESTAATATGTATDVAVAAIGVDDAYRFTGYVYLNAGSTYTIGGYRDDTLMVKIGGNSVYAVGFNNWGTISGTGFTPAVSGYYSLEVIAYNGDGAGSLDLTMAVGNAAPVDLNTTNFRLYPDTSSFASSGTVVGGLVPNGDGGYFPTSVVGNEDTTIPLGTIAASLRDTDGSESLALRIGAIPVGATLSDGVHTFVATAGATTADVTGWTLGSLTLKPATNVSGDFTLDVIATSTDSNGSTATTHAGLPVQVVATADAPTLAGSTTLISMAQGSGASATLNLPILGSLNDTDGSETLSVTIAGVPTGATLNHGSNDGAGTWTVTAADLADLSLTLPAGYTSSGTSLTVTAVSTESSNGATASTTSSLTLIADYTTSTTTGTTGNDTSLNGNSNNNFISGLGGNDTIDARGGNDLVRGGDGADNINGNTGNDVLYGDAGNDIIIGGAGNDRIVGGTGNDTLTGGATPGTPDATTDVFAWSLADAGAKGAPAVDTITDFNTSAASAGGDVLDLRDLLSGDALGPGNTVGNLANYLDFSVSGSGASTATTIHISSNGTFANGNYTGAQEDQTIVLQGVNLPTALGLASNATDAQIIQELVNRGKLMVDSGG